MSKWQYRKRPVVVEAVQWAKLCGDADGPDWWHEARGFGQITVTQSPLCANISTPEGVMRADPDDWIIRGVKGELYPCKPDIFAALYDRVGLP
jgi:hypothetical protein